MGKQTAVGWLLWELSKVGYLPNGVPEEVQKQAKAIEREQIVDAITQYEIKHHNIQSEHGILNIVDKAEQYYEQTYGKEASHE